MIAEWFEMDLNACIFGYIECASTIMEIYDTNSPPSPLSSRREGWRLKGDGVSLIK
jgi:hypothetical protein